MSSSSRDMALSARPRLSAHVRLQWDAVREQQVILMPEGVLALNATAAAIVALCNGQRCVSDIVATLSEQYPRAVEQEVLTFLSRLTTKRVLEVTDEEGE